MTHGTTSTVPVEPPEPAAEAPAPAAKAPRWEEAVVAFEDDLCRHGYGERTVDSYGEMVERFGRFYREELGRPGPYLTRLKAADLAAFVAHVRGPGHWAARSVNIAVCALRHFARFLLSSGWQRRDLAAELSTVRVSRRETPVRLTAGELEQLRQAARRHRRNGERDLAMLLLLVECGLRVGELEALTVGDVLLGSKEPAVIVHNGGGAEERRVPLSGAARAALAAHLRLRGELSRAAPLFAARHGPGALSNAQIENLVKGWLTAAGRPELSAADLRHHFGYAFYARTGDLEQLRAILGLRSRAADRYARLPRQPAAGGTAPAPRQRGRPPKVVS